MNFITRVAAASLIVVGLLYGQVVMSLDADNYRVINYDVDMILDRDSENRSTLRTVETINAEFPSYDQNHGVERVFVKQYDGHSTSFKLESVTDENNKPLNYHWSGDALRIGDSDEFVHGKKTYKITYSQRDVTRYYADTNRSEFYWDVIGVDWRVPIQKATIKLMIDKKLVASRQGDGQCYSGALGSTTQCTLTKVSDDSFETSLENRSSYEGVTLALGFAPQTFAAYKMSLWEKLLIGWAAVQTVVIAPAVGFVIWLIVKVVRSNRRSREIGTIVPEYLPPKEISVTTAASLGSSTAVMSAQLLDLAVRHYIKIYEVKAKSTWSPAEYEIEILKPIDGLLWEEQELLRDAFGRSPAVGDRLNLKTLRSSGSYFARTSNNDKDLQKLIRGEYGLRQENTSMKRWLRKIALICAIFGFTGILMPLIGVAVVAFIASFFAWPLTDKGLKLSRYLKGLKDYIGLAETDRIKALQSPEGVEKIAETNADGASEAGRIVLYERVLPYAVLFGQEKEWNKQLGTYYEQTGTQPDWYASNGTFNAVAFSSGMSGISTASASANSSSSSSGGSSGGGSSGGGGGGGGGGGW